MKKIDKIRKDTLNLFEENRFQKGEIETFLSPSKEFRLEIINFYSTEKEIEITKVEIYSHKEKIFDFLINESNIYHGWVEKNGVEYLICAEDIFGCQTIVDLTNRKMNGFSPEEEGFIWTAFHLSPNGKTLATIGCYWACQYVIKLFDFSNPLELPLKEIKEIELLDNDEIIFSWIDDETIQMKGIKSEKEIEYCENNSFRMKTISEKKIERQIKINGS